MTYGEIKRAVLELIDQHSAAGTEIAATYNNQADALSRLPGFVNAALSEIRTVVPDHAVHHADLTDRSEYGWISVRLPDDCQRILFGGVRKITPNGPEPCPLEQRVVWDQEILLKPGEYFIPYVRCPQRLPVSPTPPDTYDLRERPDVLDCAFCQAAARLVMREDEFTYAALMNEYESRLARLVPQPTAEYIPIVC